MQDPHRAFLRTALSEIEDIERILQGDVAQPAPPPRPPTDLPPSDHRMLTLMRQYLASHLQVIDAAVTRYRRTTAAHAADSSYLDRFFEDPFRLPPKVGATPGASLPPDVDALLLEMFTRRETTASVDSAVSSHHHNVVDCHKAWGISARVPAKAPTYAGKRKGIMEYSTK